MHLQRFPDRLNWPLSFTELGLFRLISRDPNQRAYNFIFPLELRTPCTPLQTQTALRFLVARHDALHTGFSWDEEGRAVRRLHGSADLDFVHTELSGLAPDDRLPALRARIQRLSDHRFDLAQPPLMVAEHITGLEHPFLLVLLNHLVYDGWSGRTLTRELMTVLGALANGGAVSLPRIPLRAADYALAAEQTYADRMEPAAWPLPPEDPWRLPLDRSLPAAPTPTAARLQRPLGAELDGALPAALVAAGAGLAAGLVAAVAYALARRSQRADPSFTLVQGNRRYAGLLHTVGYFVYGDALEVDLRGCLRWRDLLSRAAAVLAVDPSDRAPYNVVMQPPAMRVLLNIHYARVVTELPPELVWRVDLAPKQDLFAVHDLLFQFIQTPFGNILDVGYRPEVLDESSVVVLVDDLIQALESFVRSPDGPVSVIR